MFQVSDRVYCEYYNKIGTVVSTNSGSNNYPIRVQFDDNSTNTYTRTGAASIDGRPWLKIHNTSDQYTITQIEHLARLVTLPDGTRIYHPASGQPFQLTTKETLI